MSLTPRLTMIGMYKYDPDLFHLLSLPDGMDRDLFVNSLLMRYGENPVVFPSVPFFKSAVGVWSAKWYDSLERMLEAITEEYNPLHNYDRHETYTDTEAKESAGSDRVTRSDTETATRTAGKTAGKTATTTGSDTKNGTVTDSGSESSEYVTDTTTTSSEEKKISAENESTYQPDNSTEDTGTLDSTVTGEVTKGNTRTNTETGSNTENLTENITENITENNNKTGSGTDTRTTSGTDDRTLQHNAHLYGNIGVTTSQQMLMEEINLRKDLSIYDVAAELFYREFCLYVY